jgi:NADH-quinone oxidoreductase subunit L
MMTVPLMILAFLSVVGGFIGFPIVEGWNKFSEFLAPVLAQGAPAEAAHHAVSFEVAMMLVSMAIAGLGILLAYKMYIKDPRLPDQMAQRYPVPYSLIAHKYWVDEIYDWVFVGPLVRFSVFLWKIIDDVLVDGAVNGVAAVARGGSEVFKRLQTGNLQGYALSILVGVVLMVGYLLVNSN